MKTATIDKRQRKKLHPLMWAVIGISIASIAIFVVALLLPPPGEVNGNVLKGIAILTGQQGLVVFAYAVYSGKTATFTHGNTQATVGNAPPPPEPRPQEVE